MSGLRALDTQNHRWASDKTKFGYRMLERMGWREGKGLGVREDGATEHIRIRKKVTTAGVGAQTEPNGAWHVPAQVANGLDDVLKGLQPLGVGEHQQQGNDGKAKRTKKRGFYERRRQGKNVRGYSQKDLREIFGGAACASQQVQQRLSGQGSVARPEGDTQDELPDVTLKQESVVNEETHNNEEPASTVPMKKEPVDSGASKRRKTMKQTVGDDIPKQKKRVKREAVDDDALNREVKGNEEPVQEPPKRKVKLEEQPVDEPPKRKVKVRQGLEKEVPKWKVKVKKELVDEEILQRGMKVKEERMGEVVTRKVKVKEERMDEGQREELVDVVPERKPKVKEESVDKVLKRKAKGKDESMGPLPERKVKEEPTDERKVKMKKEPSDDKVSKGKVRVDNKRVELKVQVKKPVDLATQKRAWAKEEEVEDAEPNSKLKVKEESVHIEPVDTGIPVKEGRMEEVTVKLEGEIRQELNEGDCEREEKERRERRRSRKKEKRERKEKTGIEVEIRKSDKKNRKTKNARSKR